jgi:cytochrome P450
MTNDHPRPIDRDATGTTPATAGASGAGVIADDRTPEERLAAMAFRRSACPIAPLDAADGPWYLASHRAVAEALPSVAQFGGAAGSGDVALELRSFNGYPEPLHGQVRRIVNGLVAAHRAKAADPFIREQCAALADELAAAALRPGGAAGVDVAAGFVDRLPCAVIAWLLGWPTDDPVQLYRWTVTLCDRAMEMVPGSSLSSADLCPDFAAYVDERLDARLALDRAQWPDDGLTHMLVATIDGLPLSRTMIRTQLIFLLGAGSETSRDLIGGLLLDLARDPALYARLRADRSLVPAAIEEGLRLWAPTQFMVRRCLASVAIDGQPFAPDDIVLFGLASANRDEQVFAEPDRFDLDRPNGRAHLSFGGGPHVCPGAALARAEAQHALDAFLDRFAALAVAPGGTQPIPIAMFGGPKSLRLVLTPA